MQIQEFGRHFKSQYFGSYVDQYRVIEHTKIQICFYGCVMTLLSTGQTVRVNPNDSVVIDDGVMNVYPSVGERGGW